MDIMGASRGGGGESLRGGGRSRVCANPRRKVGDRKEKTFSIQPFSRLPIRKKNTTTKGGGKGKVIAPELVQRGPGGRGPSGSGLAQIQHSPEGTRRPSNCATCDSIPVRGP